MQTARHACALALVLAVSIAAPPAPAETPEAPGGVVLRWLGVAGFSIADDETVLLQDPYLSRPGLLRCLLRRYRPDEEVLARLLDPSGPAPELARARTILIGHSHFDHLGDAPWLAVRTGAEVVGSQTTRAISLGYGLPAAQARRADPGARFRVGAFEVRVVESRHARVLLGAVPLPGKLSDPPEAPIHARSFRLGDARDHLLTHAPSGLRLYITSSAAVHRPALEALHAEGIAVDVLLAAIQGRDDAYVPALVELLRPRLVIPHHTDDFFAGIDEAGAGAPRDPDDLAQFEREIRDAAVRLETATEVRRLDLFESLRLGRGSSGGPPSRR